MKHERLTMNILTHCNGLCRSDPFRTGTIAESAWPIAMPTHDQLQRQINSTHVEGWHAEFWLYIRHLRLGEFIS